MQKRHFRELLEARWTEGKRVCVGLDSDLSKIPACACKDDSPFARITIFNDAIIAATHDLVLAYKPNLAFYLSHGVQGINALIQTVNYIRVIAPEVPVILDAKFADIGNTNLGYAKFAYDEVSADAVTLHPYLGGEALKPFLDREEKGAIILCRTSNPGADEFQDFITAGGGTTLYQYVAHNVSTNWNKNGNCALVVGATYPQELAEVRSIVGDMPILIPGIGAQGGDLEATVRAGKDSRNQGMIINSSRGIIFASKGEDFADAARRETQTLTKNINQILKGEST